MRQRGRWSCAVSQTIALRREQIVLVMYRTPPSYCTAMYRMALFPANKIGWRIRVGSVWRRIGNGNVVAHPVCLGCVWCKRRTSRVAMSRSRPGCFGRGNDTVGNPHRAQICQFKLFEFILFLKLDNVEQFEARVSQSTVPSPPLLTLRCYDSDEYTIYVYVYIYIYREREILTPTTCIVYIRICARYLYYTIL